MKIIQIGLGWFPENSGGLDRFYFDLVQRLLIEGHEIHGFVVGSGSVRKESKGVVTAFAKNTDRLPSRLLGLMSAFDKIMSQKDVDLIVSHFALYAFPVLYKIKDKPFVVHFQGPWSLESGIEGKGRAFRFIKHFIEKSVYQKADRCIVLSNAFKEILVEKYGVNPSLVHVIPGGVDYLRFAVSQSVLAARKCLGWPLDRPIILVVRRLARRMGLENLIYATRKIHEKFPEALVLIAGTGPLKNELESKIKELHLEDSIKLLGFLPDDILPQAYRAANLSLVPTTQLEGFGLITLESMAAGTPVLVTPVGGLPETVRGLSNNLVLPDSTPESLANGVLSALDGNLRLPSKQECQEYVKKYYDWPIVCKKIVDVYRGIVN